MNIRKRLQEKVASESLLQKDILFEDAQRSAMTDIAALAGLTGGMSMGAALSKGGVGGTMFGGALGLAAPLIVNEYMKRKALQRAVVNDHELRQKVLQEPYSLKRHIQSASIGGGAGLIAGGLVAGAALPAAPVAALATYHIAKPVANNLLIKRKLELDKQASTNEENRRAFKIKTYGDIAGFIGGSALGELGAAKFLPGSVAADLIGSVGGGLAGSIVGRHLGGALLGDVPKKELERRAAQYAKDHPNLGLVEGLSGVGGALLGYLQGQKVPIKNRLAAGLAGAGIGMLAGGELGERLHHYFTTK